MRTRTLAAAVALATLTLPLAACSSTAPRDEVVVAAAAVTCVKAVRMRAEGRAMPTSEEPDTPSLLFLPRGLAPSKDEKKVMAELGLRFDDTSGGH